MNKTTLSLLQKKCKKFNNIILVHNKFGKGVKYALKAGVEKSKYNNILVTAVDEIFPILSMNMIVNENYDFISGTRYKNGGKRLGGSFIGHCLSLLANKSFSLITAFPLSDLTTGIKMFKKVFNRIEISSNPVGWVFAFELTAKAYVMNLKIGEVPLISIDRLFGESLLSDLENGLRISQMLFWGLNKFIKK